MQVNQIIETLRARVGEEIYVGQWVQMDQARIDLFAEATEDRQWIHTDPDRASTDSPYGTTIAHGYLTLSLLPHLTGLSGGWPSELPAPAMAVNYGLDRVRFPAPVRSSDRVRARVRLLGVEQRKGGLMVEEEVTVEREGADRPGCVAETLTLLFL
jgi:acyl dehydratase